MSQSKFDKLSQLVAEVNADFAECKKVLLASNFLFDKYPLSEGRWNSILYKFVENSTDFSSLFKGIINYGKLVDLEMAPPDALNCCDGSTSPLSTFITWIFEKSVKTTSIVKSDKVTLLSGLINQLAGDATNEGSAPCKWILLEMSSVCWSDPDRYFTILITILNNPIVGPFMDISPVRFASCCLDQDVLDQQVQLFLESYVDKYGNTPQSYFGEKFKKSEKLTLDMWVMIQLEDICENHNKWPFPLSKTYLNKMIFQF